MNNKDLAVRLLESEDGITIDGVTFRGFDAEKIHSIEDKLGIINKFLLMLSRPDERRGIHSKLASVITPMSEEDIAAGEKSGAGHGQMIPPNEIQINPHMSARNILINYTHEHVHYFCQDLTEWSVDVLTDKILKEAKVYVRDSKSHYQSYLEPEKDDNNQQS